MFSSFRAFKYGYGGIGSRVSTGLVFSCVGEGGRGVFEGSEQWSIFFWYFWLCVEELGVGLGRVIRVVVSRSKP